MTDQCGNPLLRDWVKEWMEEFQKMGAKKIFFTYKRAFTSLSKCPMTFSHPREAMQLEGIGEVIAKKLEERMIKYCRDNGLPPPTKKRKSGQRSQRAMNDFSEEAEREGNTRVKKRKTKAYVPQQRSGAYAILLCLLDYHDQGVEKITESQICRDGQRYADISLTRKEAGSHYNGFSSIKTLISKGYVWRNGKPARYSLSDTGLKMAEYTREVENGVPDTQAPQLDDDDDDSGLRMVAGMSDLTDDDIYGLDLSLYVLDPSKHSSISLNGRTKTTQPSVSASSSQNTTQNTSTNRNSNSNSTSNNNRTGTSSRNNRSGTSSSNNRSGTSSNNRNYTSNNSSRSSSQTQRDPMDDILGNDIDDEMSKYVLNPSKHSSISLNEGAKVLNRSGSSSSSSRMDQELSNYVLDPSKHSSISLNGGSTVYNRTESSNSVNITSTPFSNDINSKKKGDHLSKALSFDLGDLTEEELTLNMNLTQETRASSVDSDVIEILSPPPQSSQPTLSNRAKSPPIFSSQPLLPKSPPADVVALDEDDDDILDFFPQSQARSQTIKEDTFHFTFIDTEGNQVRHLSQAAVSVDTSENCVMYRLQFYTSQRQHDNAPPIKDVEVDHEDREYAFAYISEKDIKSAICPGLPARPVLELHHDDDNQTNDFWPPDSSQSRVDVIRKKKHPSQTITSSQTSTSSSQIDSSQNMFSQPMVPASSQKTSSSQTSSISGSQPVPVSQLVAESETTISYSPDEYEILLVLDSREIQMQKDRQYFQRLLKIKGINVITRSLDLGDVIWVARKKGHENPADELYLDFVVERKRLDDLVSSIKDGRFNEQKGRLKRSCSRKVIYIIEEYDRESANQFSAQAIQTAMSSTQIVDGFFLKHTNSPEETIDYLVLLTRKIEQIYRNTTLHVIPEHIITRQNFISLKNAYQERAAESDKAYLITYPLYSDLNKKTGSTTLHDIYMRMLMTIRGINAERALTLMKIYPTPAALLQVLSGKTAEQGKTLAKDATKDQIARRKWNTSTSEKLYEIWGTAVYPDDEGSDDPDS